MRKRTYCFSPQNKALIKHFLYVSPRITPMSAQVNYSIMRLASRIDELRKNGFFIEKDMLSVNGHRYASYEFCGHIYESRADLKHLFRK